MEENKSHNPAPAALLRRWHFRVDRMQGAYYEAARQCDSRHYWFGVPVFALSAVVGTAVFASIAKNPSQDIRVQILVGMLSMLAAVLSGLQTFLRFSERAEKFRLAGANFANIKATIEILQIDPPSSPTGYAKALKDIEAVWDRVRKESPSLPRRLWKKFEQAFEPESMP